MIWLLFVVSAAAQVAPPKADAETATLPSVKLSDDATRAEATDVTLDHIKQLAERVSGEIDRTEKAIEEARELTLWLNQIAAAQSRAEVEAAAQFTTQEEDTGGKPDTAEDTAIFPFVSPPFSLQIAAEESQDD